MLAFFLAAALMQLSHVLITRSSPCTWKTSLWPRRHRPTLVAGVVAEVLIFLVMPQLLARLALNTLLVAAFLIAAGRWLLLAPWPITWRCCCSPSCCMRHLRLLPCRRHPVRPVPFRPPPPGPGPVALCRPCPGLAGRSARCMLAMPGRCPVPLPPLPAPPWRRWRGLPHPLVR